MNQTSSTDKASLDFTTSIRRYFDTRKSRINALKNSVDFEKLTPVAKVRLEMLEDNLDETSKGIDAEIDRLERHWERAQKSVAKLASEGSNGGISGFFENGDSE